MSWLGDIFGASDLQKQANADNSALATADQAYAPGGKIYNHIRDTEGQPAADKVWAQVQGHLGVDVQQSTNIDGQITDEFDAGLKEGFDNVTGGINSALKLPFQFAWKAIPWQVFALVGALAFFYLGGAKLLRIK